MQLYEKTDNREGRMYTGQTMGLLALARGDWRGAEKSLLEVLQLGREFEDPLTQALALGQLGRAAQWQGDFGAALASMRQGLEALTPDGDPRGRAELGLFEADLAFEVGMLDAGRKSLTEVKKFLDASGSLEQRAEWWRLTGTGHLRAKDFGKAREAFEGARREAGRERERDCAPRYRARCDGSVAGGRRRACTQSLTELHAEAQGLGHVPLLLQSGELLARAQAQAGRLAEAERQLRAALRTADSHPPWGGRYRLHGQLAGVLERLGRGKDAGQQRRAAATEIERLRKGMDATQRESFEQLEEVRQLAGSVEKARAA